MLIKKVNLGVLALALGVSSGAFAQDPTNKFYLGVDVQANRFSLGSQFDNLKFNGSSVNKNLGAFSVLGGYRWCALSAEVGYTYFQKKNYSGTVTNNGIALGSGNMSVKNYNFYVDGIYNRPINRKFDLKALVGLGIFTTKITSGLALTNNGTSNAGVRLGLGAQYNITSDFNTSLMYKFQTINNDAFKNMNTIALSFVYAI